MDAEKGTEVEMKELLPAEVQDNKDAEKGKMEEKKEAEKAADEKKEEKEKKEEIKKEEKEKDEIKEDKENEGKKEQEKKEENKDKKEEETSVYCKLQTPTEDIYNPVMPSTSKSKEEAEKKEKEITEEESLYSKLQTPTEDIYNAPITSSMSKRKKAGKEEEKEKEEDVYCKLKDPSEDIYMSAVTSSTLKQTKEVHRQVRLYKRISVVLAILSIILLAVVFALVIKSHECESSNCAVPVRTSDNIPRYQCSLCGRGWLKIENSCYFKSKERLNWQESRKACQERGGDLAVVHNETVQHYLSMRQGLLFWIGLHYAETKHQWIWIDNTTLTMSFWATSDPPKKPKDHCALLHGRTNSSNWHSYPCHAISQYICQKY